MKSILLVKTSSLGDVVHNMPAVTDVRRRWPRAHIHWLVEEAFAPLARLHPGVDEVIAVATRRWRTGLLSASTWREIAALRRRLRAPAYDRVVDTQGLVRSALLAAMIMANVPLALVGAVVALWLSGQPLSVAALVGFVTLTGISARNGILKISHYINLCAFEGERFGEAMIVRGSQERLTPVLMTALVAAFALIPLLVSADAPGKEILHPVAVVIFGGLISSTLLDSLITPLMFNRWGRAPLERLLAAKATDAY